MILRYAFFIFCLTLLLAACESDGLDKSQPSTTIQHLQRDKTADQELVKGSFSVRILPNPLTTADRADAVISGCRMGSHFQWKVNGNVLPDHELRYLGNTFFQRGDSILLKVSCGSQVIEEEIIIKNTPPTVSAVKFQSSELTSGQDLTVIPVSEDLDGDFIEYRYEWVLDGILARDFGGATLPGHLLKKGTRVTLAITPFDNFSDGTTFQGVSFSIPNTAPTIGSQPPPLSSSSDLYVYSVKAADPDNDELVYRLNQGPDGMIIDKKTGYLSWPIDQNTPIGNFDIEIIVEDPEELQARQFYTLSLSRSELEN